MLDPFRSTPLGDSIVWIHPLTAAIVIGWAIYLVADSRARSERPWCAPAVASGVLAVIHPDVWLLVLVFLEVPYLGLPWAGDGGRELKSFLYSLVMIVLAIVGGVRVLRSKRKLRGLPFCVPALLIGGGIVIYWIWVASMLMRGF